MAFLQRISRAALFAGTAAVLGFHAPWVAGAAQTSAQIPSTPLAYGAFAATFAADGSFVIAGQGWPRLAGTWRVSGDEVALVLTGGPANCEGPGRYRVRVSGAAVAFDLLTDDCQPRRMILDRSSWLPPGAAPAVPARSIVRTEGQLRAIPAPPPSAGNWPSFRGPQAAGVAGGQGLPDRWNATTGENIIWRKTLAGLAHSSPIVWGDLLFVTTAESSDPKATFRPGLYGDGDASEDRSRHRWMLQAFDKRTGDVRWERTVASGAPVDKRHIKSTYASATPATDGRVVVAWFGSMGVHAFDLGGQFLWKVDLGRIDLGAYDIPSFEWGPASSPIIWGDLVILQVDTQADSFLLALDVLSGRTVWKTDRDELPSWGTPTVAETSAGPVLVTNAANFIRAYDPRTGRELWRIGRSSKITAPTPIFADDLFVIASGRAPERPIFVVRPGAQGDLTLQGDATTNEAIVWSRTGRGSYMPTPLAYDGLLYVLANNGVLDAYELGTGAEIYRQRLPNVGSGFSASPVAAGGKIFLSSEDGEILVIQAGRTFSLVATNAMGELIMATPALSEGVMYVKSAASLFAIGQKR